MNDRYIVIMAGGRGERFWPKSRLKKPKHLISVVGKEPMLLQTINRLKAVVPKENLFIITNKEQREAVIELCCDLAVSQIIAEPIGRDTAAAVGLAKVLVKQKNPKGVFAVLPADHVINDVENLEKCLSAGFEIALKEDVLVTIGIPPTEPSTAYGYIKKGAVKDIFYKVEKFVEKPDYETAKKYLATGDFFWNAGMFVWSVKSLDAALKKHCHDLWLGLTALEASPYLEAALETLYVQLPKISIDYALLEKADNVVTIPATFDWDDVGEWPAIARHSNVDSQNNVIVGDAVITESQGNIIVNEDGHLTALIGVEDLIVVHTKDATLICHKDKAQDIKKLLKKVSEEAKYIHLL